MPSKVAKFTLWVSLIVCLLLAGCFAFSLWGYIFEDPGEPYRVVDELFAEPEEKPEPPPNPIIYEGGKAYFEAEGIRFRMPYGFRAEYPDAYGPKPGPHFDYYYRSDARGAAVRVRRTTGGAGSVEEIETYARLYVEMGAGELVGEARVAALPAEELEAIGADAGAEALYELAPENRSSWGYSYEYVLFAGKKPDTVWTVSIAIMALDEGDAELMRRDIRGDIKLTGPG